MFNRVTIKVIGDKFRVCQTPVTYKKNRNNLKNFWASENEKLCNNVQRAKNKVFEYAYCNDFKYFVTLTVNCGHDRQNLDWLIKITTQIIRDLRKKYHLDFKFLLIPELHKDGKSWHLHGLFDESFGCDFYTNDNNYLSWKSYDRVGFSSISIIENYEACCKYITKYVSKGFEVREKSKHCYFCSKNLLKAQVVNDVVITGFLNFCNQFSNGWCSVKDLDYDSYLILNEYLYYNCYCDLMS